MDTKLVDPGPMKKIPLSFDVHMHLVGSGCHSSGCWLHPKLRNRYTIKALQWMQGISNKQLDHDLDDFWALRLSKLVLESPLSYGVILGFDGCYQHGQLDKKKSQLIVPDDWVFKVCKNFPNLLPGPSINPHSHNALERLDMCIEKGAVLIKWLPSVQLIHPEDPKHLAFYKKLAQAKLPLLVHCGGERTFKSLDPKLNHLSLLSKALEQGVTVICAHSATPVIGSGEEDQIPLLVTLLKRYANLWVDNSGLCNPGRFLNLPKLTQFPIILERTLYGSDWPVPSNSFYYLRSLGFKKVWEMELEKNLIARDLRLKLTFGYPQEIVSRAQNILAHLDRWIV